MERITKLFACAALAALFSGCASVGHVVLGTRAEPQDLCELTVHNQTPYTFKFRVGHAWWEEQSGLLPHTDTGSKPMLIEQDEEHILTRVAWVEGREIRDEYRFYVPKGTREHTITFGGLQLGVMYNRSGHDCWVVPPTQQSSAFVTLAEQRVGQLHRRLYTRAGDFSASLNLEDQGVDRGLLEVFLERATMSTAAVDSFYVQLRALNIVVPEDLMLVAKEYAAAKSRPRSARIDSVIVNREVLQPGRILGDPVIGEGVFLRHGQAAVFVVQPGNPVFVLFFGERRERRLELTTTGIDEIRGDSNFGGLWVDWYHHVDPHHVKSSKPNRLPTR